MIKMKLKGVNNELKVFITIEKDGVSTGMDSKIIKRCLDLEAFLNINEVPVQLKITSLPRRKATFRPLSDLDNVE